jgi:hypothetical protein
VTRILKLELSHKKQTQKNHEAKFLINKMMKNKIEKESFNKKVSRIKKIVIKIIRTESKKKMLRDN